MYSLQDLTDRQHFNLPHPIDIQSIPDSEARKAYDKGASGNVRGKIVVKVADELLL